MRKVIVMASIVALVVIASGCGGGKYDDAREAINTQYEMMSDFVVGIENANDSAAVVVVLEKFQKTAAGAREQMMAIIEKYPEMKENPPKDLEEQAKKMEELGPKFMGAMMKIAQTYGDDPAVQEALQKMQQALQP